VDIRATPGGRKEASKEVRKTKDLLYGEGRYLHTVFGILRIRVADNDAILARFKVVQNEII